jgi:hypothetical protein
MIAMIKECFDRTKYVLEGEEGDLNTQMVVITTATIMIAGVLFTFKHQVERFLVRAGHTVDALETKK